MAIKNKKGLSPTILIILFSFMFFFFILFFGIALFTSVKVDEAMSQIDIVVGDISFNATYNQTTFQGIKTIQNQADNMALFLLFGMIIIMIAIGFFVKGNKLWVVFDIAIFVVCFFLASHLSINFNEYISTNPEFNTIHSEFLPKSSTFLLNLPFLTTIAGVFIGIATYYTRKKGVSQDNF